MESNQTTPIPENLYFTETDYENYDFDSPNLVLNFYPRTRYSDSDTNYSTFGSWTFKENNITLNFKPGDYYFDDLSVTLSNAGLDDLQNSSMHLYPNPSSGQVNIDFPQNLSMDQITFEIYDVTGSVVYKDQTDFSQEISLDLNHLSEGTYTIRAFSKDGILGNQRLILQ